MKQHRIIIYPVDMSVLTGKSVRQCRRILMELKESLGKPEHQEITCCELGAYLNIDPEVIYKSINNLPMLPD